MKVAFARITNDLHRDVVWNPVVQDHLAVQSPYLGALIANDRSLQTQTLDPWQRSRKGSARAGHNGDPCTQQPPHRLDIARIQLKRPAEDRAVEVQGEQPIAKGYFFTSGLTRFGGLPPRAAVAMFRAAIADISDRVRLVALAMCGASTTFGAASSPGCTAGSRS